jgi:nicotinamide riboside kinase
MPRKVVRIALLGAESTGKTTLATALVQALESTLSKQGMRAVAVPEVLREWCDLQGRTPAVHEQVQIAAAQAERIFSIEDAWVIADTTPLMTAVYSDHLFQDPSIYPYALDQQARFDVNLVLGLDVAWTADGIQRDGAHVREPVDNLIRKALTEANLAYKVIYGQGDARLNNALVALREALSERLTAEVANAIFESSEQQRQDRQYGLNKGTMAWRCDLCSDAECEHKLFSDLLKAEGSVN